MKRSIRAVTTGSGTEPSSSTASWKARMLNFPPERFLRLLPGTHDRELAHIIREGLPGPGDVTVHFGFDLMLGQRGVIVHVLERLFARPTFRMNAGVHHQSRRAPDLITQHPKALVWRLVHAHFLAQLFTIKRPTFTVSRNVVESPKVRLVLVLERDRNLECVPRRGLVQRQRGQIVERAMRQIVGVQEINARTAAA